MLGMDTMRWIDHWVGMPLCFALGLLLTLVRRLGVHRSRRIRGDRTLAVFKFFGLGSIIEATPLLRAIRARYPRAQLAFVTFASNEALVRKLAICTDIRVIRTRSLVWFAWDTLRQIIWLQRQHVEAVVDLEFFSKFSTLLACFSGARIRIGFHLNDFWRRSLITHPVYFNYYRHITDVYREVARRLDTDVTDGTLTRFDVGDAPRATVRAALAAAGCTLDGPQRTPLIGVNVNAGDMCLARRWPLERFAALLEELGARHAAARFVLTGTRDEAAYVQQLVEQLTPATRARTILAAGRWKLDEFIAALPYFNVFVTNDSGPMHFAAAENVPMVSLWGPGRPAFYAPRQPTHLPIYMDYPCSPCLYMFTTFEAMWCQGAAWCMAAIDVATVLAAVERLLTPPAVGGAAPGVGGESSAGPTA
jgi:ADP-heptose:LPS heptosyltransferase